MNCGKVHSQAREMVEQGDEKKLVATVLAISRSSLYYRKRPRGSRANRRSESQIVVACGAKPTYGYRRITGWLKRKEGPRVNRKRVLRVMREQGLLVPSRRTAASAPTYSDCPRCSLLRGAWTARSRSALRRATTCTTTPGRSCSKTC